MTEHRKPRLHDEVIVLGGIPYRIWADSAIVQGDLIAYRASVPGQGPWNDVRIRELYPQDEQIRRGEDGALQCTAASQALLAQKRAVFHKSQQAEAAQFAAFPPSLGIRSCFYDAYGTSYSVRIFPKSLTLDNLLEQNPDGFPPEEAVPLVLKLLDALEFIHSRGLVHLMVHPSQLYLLSGNLLMLDQISLWPQEMTTVPSGLVCDISYTAPEVRLKDWNEVGPSADLYAAAALLFHLLCGRPFCQEMFSLTPLYERTSVPAQFVPLFHKGLHVLPRKRFATAAEFRAALQDLEWTSDKISGKNAAS